MTNGEKFLEIAREDFEEESIRTEYNGRNFYKGPAVDIDSDGLRTVKNGFPMECHYDNMGLGFVVYPCSPNAEYKETEETNYEEMSMDELIDTWQDKNKVNASYEMQRGVNNFLKLINACSNEGYGYDNVEDALADNPYLIQAMVQAIAERDDEYRNNLIQEIQEN